MLQHLHPPIARAAFALCLLVLANLSSPVVTFADKTKSSVVAPVAAPAASAAAKPATSVPAIGYKIVRVRRDVNFPRLTHFSNPTMMSVVNRQIDQSTRDFVCPSDCKTGSYKVTSSVGYADNDIFSIHASASYFCCGPYPTDDANVSQTYDLRTGRLVGFEQLFRNYEADKGKILTTIFARQIAKAEKAASSKSANKDGDCENEPSMYTADNLGNSEFTYSFSKTGLIVKPEWPHVIAACAVAVTVPYRELKKYAAPNGIILRAAN